MAHVISVGLNATENRVIDLRPCDASGVPQGPAYYHACKIKVTLYPNGGTKTIVLAQPVSVADGAAAPTAATVPAIPTSGVTGVIGLDSTLSPVVEWGQQYSKGYSPEVYKEQAGTHLLLTCGSTAATLQIVVD